MKHSVMHSVALYNKVLWGLLLLTFLTFVQPGVLPLGLEATVGVQLLIAVFKALLIAGYYMHLRSETQYLRGFVLMALIILGIFFVIVGIDVYHRY